MLKGEVILQEIGAKSGQTGELLSTSLALKKQVPVALGFPFLDCMKKIFRKTDLLATFVPLRTGRVDLVIYHSANVSAIFVARGGFTNCRQVGTCTAASMFFMA